MSKCDQAQSKLLVFDLYRVPFNFLLPDHQSSYRTLLGAVLTLITLVTMAAFANYQLMLYFDQSNFEINQVRQEYFFKPSEGIKNVNGFNVAAAIVGFKEKESYHLDSATEFDSHVDPSYGQLKFYRKNWNYKAANDTDMTKGIEFV